MEHTIGNISSGNSTATPPTLNEYAGKVNESTTDNIYPGNSSAPSPTPNRNMGENNESTIDNISPDYSNETSSTPNQIIIAIQHPTNLSEQNNENIKKLETYLPPTQHQVNTPHFIDQYYLRQYNYIQSETVIGYGGSQGTPGTYFPMVNNPTPQVHQVPQVPQLPVPNLPIPHFISQVHGQIPNMFYYSSQ